MAPVSLIQVNDEKMAIPYNSNKQLQVTIQGHWLYLTTDFELVVSFDERNNAGT